MNRDNDYDNPYVHSEGALALACEETGGDRETAENAVCYEGSPLLDYDECEDDVEGNDARPTSSEARRAFADALVTLREVVAHHRPRIAQVLAGEGVGDGGR